MKPAQLCRVDKLLRSLIVTRGLYRKKKDRTGLICTTQNQIACMHPDAGWSSCLEDLSGLHIYFVIYSGDSGSDLRRGFFLSLRRVPPTRWYWLESSP